MQRKNIALITGANKGIGFETARQLGRENTTILLGSRDQAKGEEAAARLRAEGFDVHPIMLDVSDSVSIQKAAAEVKKKFGRLDILVNNAGIMVDDRKKKISEQTLETWRKTFATNLFGVIETTNAFLPLLRQSEAGRIVNLSSILGSIEYHATAGSPIYESKQTPAYNVSKSALNAYTVQLAYELRDTKIKVNAAHPGWVKTEMGGPNAQLTPEESVTGIRKVIDRLQPSDSGKFWSHDGSNLPW